MGGDGGTLNNSRHEHTLLRRAVLQRGTQPNRDRASVTLCAASKQPLSAPIVVDRLGNLYNKHALISVLLSRARESTPATALSHIRSLRLDTAAVDAQYARNPVCPVTRKAVTAVANFSVGWTCGCVAADVDVPGVEHSQLRCVVCGREGDRVRLGMTVEERDRVRRHIDRERQLKKARKRKRKKGHDLQPPEKSARVDTNSVT